MILMSVVSAYTIYLRYGKGTVKSKIALGPFLAFGFVSVILEDAQRKLYVSIL